MQSCLFCNETALHLFPVDEWRKRLELSFMLEADSLST